MFAPFLFVFKPAIKNMGQCSFQHSDTSLKSLSVDQKSGRYVKFTCMDYYGKGCGLQYIGIMARRQQGNKC